MGNRGVLTKLLAAVGTLLACLPIAAPILFSIAGYAGSRQLRFDWMMPAELFLSALTGGLLLVWSAQRAHSRRKLIGWGFATAAGLLAAGLVIAQLSGLASGEAEPTGTWWALLLASLGGYSLAVAVMVVGGLLLCRDVFTKQG